VKDFVYDVVQPLLQANVIAVMAISRKVNGAWDEVIDGMEERKERLLTWKADESEMIERMCRQ
jgi:hypothetical protein